MANYNSDRTGWAHDNDENRIILLENKILDLEDWKNMIAISSNYSTVPINHGGTGGTTIDSALNNLNIKPKRWQWYGQFINSGSDSVAGVGALSCLIINNIAIINFALKITAAGNKYLFDWGINRDFFANHTGYTITPQDGGEITMITPSGALDGLNEYGGILIASNQFWIPGRVYTTTGNIGAWPSNQFTVGESFRGVCYGAAT